MANPEMRERVKKTLLDLGHTADEIAASFKKQEVKGVPGESEDCVVQRYLRCTLDPEKKENIEVNQIQITFDGVELHSAENVRKHGLLVMEEDILPPHIWDFITRFDRLEYRELIDETKYTILDDYDDDFDFDDEDEDDEDYLDDDDDEGDEDFFDDEEDDDDFDV